MKELSGSKKLKIIMMFFHGFSYDEIAVKINVSKGTVSNVISALKAGQFPEAANLTEEIDYLRELAIDLKQSKLTPIHALVGLLILSTLDHLGIKPPEIENFKSLIKTCAVPGTDIPALIQAALVLHDIQQSTGLSVPELEIKVTSLKEELVELEPLTNELKSKKKELTKLQDTLKKLTIETEQLKGYRDQLKVAVKESEAREAQLSTRLAELEERAYQADMQLSNARKDLKNLSNTGLSFDDLALLAQQVKEVASHHKMKPASVRDRLLAELKLIDEGLGLETFVKAKNSQLIQATEDISQLEAEKAALATSNDQLLAQRDQLQEDITVAGKNIIKEIEAIGKATQAAKDELAKELRSVIKSGLAEVNKMSDEAFKVGKQLGELTEMISSNNWLSDLASLIKGENPKGQQVRIIALMFLQALSAWFLNNKKEKLDNYFLTTAVDNTLKEMEKWAPQITTC